MIQKKKNISLIYMAHCLGCKKHNKNMASRRLTMTNKVSRPNKKCG